MRRDDSYGRGARLEEEAKVTSPASDSGESTWCSVLPLVSELGTLTLSLTTSQNRERQRDYTTDHGPPAGCSSPDGVVGDHPNTN